MSLSRTESSESNNWPIEQRFMARSLDNFPPRRDELTLSQSALCVCKKCPRSYSASVVSPRRVRRKSTAGHKLFQKLLSRCREPDRLLVPDLATEWFRKQKVFLDKVTDEEMKQLKQKQPGDADESICVSLSNENAKSQCFNCCRRRRLKLYQRQQQYCIEPNCKCTRCNYRKIKPSREDQQKDIEKVDQLVAGRNPITICTPNVANCKPETALEQPRSSGGAEARFFPARTCNCIKIQRRNSCECVFQADGQPMPDECLAALRAESSVSRLRKKHNIRETPHRRLDASRYRRISPEFFGLLKRYEEGVNERYPLYGKPARYLTRALPPCTCESSAPEPCLTDEGVTIEKAVKEGDEEVRKSEEDVKKCSNCHKEDCPNEQCEFKVVNCEEQCTECRTNPKELAACGRKDCNKDECDFVACSLDEEVVEEEEELNSVYCGRRTCPFRRPDMTGLEIVPGSKPEQFKQMPGSKPEQFKQMPGSKQEQFKQMPGSKPEQFKQMPGSKPEQFKQMPGSKKAAWSDQPELVKQHRAFINDRTIARTSDTPSKKGILCSIASICKRALQPGRHLLYNFGNRPHNSTKPLKAKRSPQQPRWMLCPEAEKPLFSRKAAKRRSTWNREEFLQQRSATGQYQPYIQVEPQIGTMPNSNATDKPSDTNTGLTDNFVETNSQFTVDSVVTDGQHTVDSGVESDQFMEDSGIKIPQFPAESGITDTQFTSESGVSSSHPTAKTSPTASQVTTESVLIDNQYTTKTISNESTDRQVVSESTTTFDSQLTSGSTTTLPLEPARNQSKCSSETTQTTSSVLVRELPRLKYRQNFSPLSDYAQLMRLVARKRVKTKPHKRFKVTFADRNRSRNNSPESSHGPSSQFITSPRNHSRSPNRILSPSNSIQRKQYKSSLAHYEQEKPRKARRLRHADDRISNNAPNSRSYDDRQTYDRRYDGISVYSPNPGNYNGLGAEIKSYAANSNNYDDGQNYEESADEDNRSYESGSVPDTRENRRNRSVHEYNTQTNRPLYYRPDKIATTGTSISSQLWHYIQKPKRSIRIPIQQPQLEESYFDYDREERSDQGSNDVQSLRTQYSNNPEFGGAYTQPINDDTSMDTLDRQEERVGPITYYTNRQTSSNSSMSQTFVKSQNIIQPQLPQHEAATEKQKVKRHNNNKAQFTLSTRRPPPRPVVVKAIRQEQVLYMMEPKVKQRQRQTRQSYDRPLRLRPRPKQQQDDKKQTIPYRSRSGCDVQFQDDDEGPTSSYQSPQRNLHRKGYITPYSSACSLLDSRQSQESEIEMKWEPLGAVPRLTQGFEQEEDTSSQAEAEGTQDNDEGFERKNYVSDLVPINADRQRNSFTNTLNQQIQGARNMFHGSATGLPAFSKSYGYPSEGVCHKKCHHYGYPKQKTCLPQLSSILKSSSNHLLKQQTVSDVRRVNFVPQKQQLPHVASHRPQAEPHSFTFQNQQLNRKLQQEQKQQQQHTLVPHSKEPKVSAASLFAVPTTSTRAEAFDSLNLQETGSEKTINNSMRLTANYIEEPDRLPTNSQLMSKRSDYRAPRRPNERPYMPTPVSLVSDLDFYTHYIAQRKIMPREEDQEVDTVTRESGGTTSPPTLLTNFMDELRIKHFVATARARSHSKSKREEATKTTTPPAPQQHIRQHQPTIRCANLSTDGEHVDYYPRRRCCLRRLPEEPLVIAPTHGALQEQQRQQQCLPLLFYGRQN